MSLHSPLIVDGAVKCHFGFFDGKMDGDYRYITVEPKKTVSFAGGEDQQAQNIVMGRANVAVKLKDGTNIKGESRIGENEDIKVRNCGNAKRRAGNTTISLVMRRRTLPSSH